MSTVRQAKLKPECAELYPTLPARMWTSAAWLAQLVGAYRRAQPHEARALPELEFSLGNVQHLPGRIQPDILRIRLCAFRMLIEHSHPVGRQSWTLPGSSWGHAGPSLNRFHAGSITPATFRLSTGCGVLPHKAGDCPRGMLRTCGHPSPTNWGGFARAREDYAQSLISNGRTAASSCSAVKGSAKVGTSGGRPSGVPFGESRFFTYRIGSVGICCRTWRINWGPFSPGMFVFVTRRSISRRLRTSSIAASPS